MKFRSREFNVFSMSALDLFASALGAFILITIVLMPYFLRLNNEEVMRMRMELAETRASLEQAERALMECQEREASCQAELESARRDAESLQGCQADLNACQKRLSKTFLAVVIQWATRSHDVDLHIVDPAGKEFYYVNKRFSGHPGELSADTTVGPGVEIWEVPAALPGKYRVLYNLYKKGGNDAPAVVKGGVYHRDGHDRLGERRLTREGRKEMVAEITVGDDGDVEISTR